MFSRWAALPIAVSLSVTTLVAQQSDRITLPADHSAVYDLVGQVQVESGTGKDVVVEIVRRGRDASQLTVERGTVADRRRPGTERDAIRIMFPADEIVYPGMPRGSNSSFSVRDDGTFGGNDDGNGKGHRGWRRGGDRGHRVTIRSDGPGLEAYADLKIQLPEGADFAVYLGVGKATLTNVNGRIHVDAASSSVTAQGIRGSLGVDVGSGSVSVTKADADLSIDTGSGDVKITGIHGRELSIDTGSGEITGSDVTVDKASLETGSGGLRVSGVRGADFHFETGSGDIDVELAADVHTVSVETGSGDVVLHVPPTIGAMVDFDTGSGRIEADIPLEIKRWARDHVTGRMGDGDGRLHVETGSGNVRILGMAAGATPKR